MHRDKCEVLRAEFFGLQVRPALVLEVSRLSRCMDGLRKFLSAPPQPSGTLCRASQRRARAYPLPAARPRGALTRARGRAADEFTAGGGRAGGGRARARGPVSARNRNRRRPAPRGRTRTPATETCWASPPPPPSRTKWTRLVHPSVLIGHVSSLPGAVQLGAAAGAERLGAAGWRCTRRRSRRSATRSQRRTRWRTEAGWRRAGRAGAAQTPPPWRRRRRSCGRPTPPPPPPSLSY